LVDEVVVPMQSSVYPTPIFGGDVPSDHVVLQPIQLVVEKVATLMKSSLDPTLLLGSIDSTKVFTVMQYSADPNLLLESVDSTKVVMSMQSLADPTLFLESVDSTKVVMSLQDLADPTLLMGSDVSTDYIFSISISVLLEQGGIPITSGTPPPSTRMVSFDWNDLFEPHLPYSTPFQIRVEVNSKHLPMYYE
jgi:hypothetical protein